MSLKFTRAVERAQGISARAKSLLMILADKADRHGRSFYRQEMLAEFACCSRRTVVSALADLEAAGWITRTHQQRRDGSRSSDVISVHDLTKAAKNVVDRQQLQLPLLLLIDCEEAVDNSLSKVQDLHIGQSARFAQLLDSYPIKKEINRSSEVRDAACGEDAATSLERKAS